MLDREQLQEFTEHGFVVIPQAIPEDLVAEASRTIDALVARKPPGENARGHHFYWPEAVNVPSLLALFTESPAWSCAESLTGPGTLEVPWQVQVALNIPPFSHRPGGHHIDGFPPNRTAALEPSPCWPGCCGGRSARQHASRSWTSCWRRTIAGPRRRARHRPRSTTTTQRPTNEH